MGAVQATLHCLAGCATGEVVGMVAATALAWHNAAQIALSVALAFLFGYSLTMWPLLKMKISFRQAVLVALAADTVSMAVMEIVDNGFVALVPGALNAGLGQVLFWWSLVVSLVIAFIIATPVNAWLMSKGKGHAAMHKHHH